MKVVRREAKDFHLNAEEMDDEIFWLETISALSCNFTFLRLWVKNDAEMETGGKTPCLKMCQ